MMSTYSFFVQSTGGVRSKANSRALRLLLETGVGLFGSGIERIRRSSSKQPARATVRSLLRHSLTTSHAHFRGPVDAFQLQVQVCSVSTDIKK